VRIERVHDPERPRRRWHELAEPHGPFRRVGIRVPATLLVYQRHKEIAGDVILVGGVNDHPLQHRFHYLPPFQSLPVSMR
jgi:hypothetical protein